MNDNDKPTRGKHDGFARSLLSEKALALIAGLPALLKHDTLETLKLEVVEAQENHRRAVQAIDAHYRLSPADRSDEVAATLLRWEYLARKSVEIYTAEIVARQAEKRSGLH